MRRVTLALALGAASWAWADEAGAQASEEPTASGDITTTGAPPPPPADLEGTAHSGDSFMRRYRPTPLALEVGLFGGAYWFSDDHNLQDLDVAAVNGHEELGPGGEIGLRVGFYPLSFLGAEVEGGLILNQTETSDDEANVWLFRGHGILQLPIGRLVPFVLGGGGLMSLRASGSLGNDRDPVAYFGGGLKFALHRYLSLRLDVRDNVTQKNKLLSGIEDGDSVHNLEVLGGLSVTIGRTPWSAAPPDQDRDGVYDPQDACPTVAGPKPRGCPPPPDGDGDGIADPSDPCPNEAEDQNPPDPSDGCPNKDADGDGIQVPADLCPGEAGIAPDGCPPKDSDGDGIMDPDDRCPQEPETKNNYEDQDGCADEVPQEVKKFTGVIKGIMFQSGKATIRPTSFPLLNDAVRVLQQYPKLRIRVSGHTDSTGKHDVNMQLSEDRAGAVKTYLVSKGVDPNRIETRGAGPDEPIADNKTIVGRGQNRRIEFELLPQ